MPILYRSQGLAIPPTVRPPAPVIALDLEWHGADGSVWRLTDPTSLVRLLPGVRGLEADPVDRWTADAPALPGARYVGHRVGPREVFLPIYRRAGSSADWLAVRRAWDRSLSPDVEGQLVCNVAGERRTLPCRWARTEQAWTRDPLAAGRSITGEYLIADGAYWQGAPVVRLWTQQAGEPFFVADGGVFHVTPSNTLGSARIPNPGDVPAWPVWTITGPAATVTIGVDGAEIEIPFALAAGESLTIDTRPDAQTVEDHTGADRVADLPSIEFRPVPAGSAVELALAATDTGPGFIVAAALTPLHRRAW